MGSQLGAVPGRILYDLFFFRGELVKEDSRIGSILHCILIPDRCPAAGVAHGVFVSRLSCRVPGCGRVPPVLCLPAADRIIFKMEIVRQLPEDSLLRLSPSGQCTQRGRHRAHRFALPFGFPPIKNAPSGKSSRQSIQFRRRSCGISSGRLQLVSNSV